MPKAEMARSGETNFEANWHSGLFDAGISSG